MSKKTIIFDFDGTIADTLELQLKLLTKYAWFLGIKDVDKARETIEKFRDFPLVELIEELEISRFKLPFVIWKVRRDMNKEMDDVKPFSEMPNIIKQLKKEGFLLGIVSSNSHRNIDKFLVEQGLNIFDFVHSEKNFFGKDRVLKKIIKNNHLDVDDVIYIGDELRDEIAANKAGIKVISVTWGYNSEKLLAKHNINIARKPKDILPLIEKLLL